MTPEELNMFVCATNLPSFQAAVTKTETELLNYPCIDSSVTELLHWVPLLSATLIANDLNCKALGIERHPAKLLTCVGQISCIKNDTLPNNVVYIVDDAGVAMLTYLCDRVSSTSINKDEIIGIVGRHTAQIEIRKGFCE